MSVLVVAEPGATAEGNRDTMLRLIDTAAHCGANVFKTTWLSDAQRLCDRRHAQEYLSVYRWHQWPRVWHGDFRTRCQVRGMQYACTVDIPEDLAVVAPYVDYLKIAHFEAHSRSLHLAYAAQSPAKCPPLLLSVAGGTFKDYGGWPDTTHLLHTVSSYPAPLSALNLSCIQPYTAQSTDYQDFKGYSDHSRHLLAGAIAVACGADIVETHYRLDDCDPSNPDYAVAFSPAEFRQYIQNIRDTEVMLGDGRKKLEECEEPLMKHRVTA